MSIFSIGILTAVIGDLAAHFGCYSHIKDSITAITIVALGTSVPGKSNLWQNYFFIITQVQFLVQWQIFVTNIILSSKTF